MYTPKKPQEIYQLVKHYMPQAPVWDTRSEVTYGDIQSLVMQLEYAKTLIAQLHLDMSHPNEFINEHDQFKTMCARITQYRSRFHD